MINSILVVCIGNICRSPVGERVLQLQLPNMKVKSAGLGALVGHSADLTASEVAQELGISLDGHKGRQFTVELGTSQDLILAMEPAHRSEIGRIAPQLLGKTMLYGHWTDGRGIEDPYKASREFHEMIFGKIKDASDAWVSRLRLDK